MHVKKVCLLILKLDLNSSFYNAYIIFVVCIGRPIGEMILYFGCRKREEDFIYEDELEEYLANGTLTKVNLNCIESFE